MSVSPALGLAPTHLSVMDPVVGSALGYMPYMAYFNENTTLKVELSSGSFGPGAIASMWFISDHPSTQTNNHGIIFEIANSIAGNLNYGLQYEIKSGKPILRHNAFASQVITSATRRAPQQYLTHAVVCVQDLGSTRRVTLATLDSLGVSQSVSPTITLDDSISLCEVITIGARHYLNNRNFKGYLGDIWIKTGVYTSLTAADVATTYFRDADGYPINPGLTGEDYGLGVPDVFLGGEGYGLAEWNAGTNRGSLQDMTLGANPILEGYGVLPKTLTAVSNGPAGQGTAQAIGGAASHADQDLIYIQSGVGIKSYPSSWVDDGFGETTVVADIRDITAEPSGNAAIENIHVSNSNDVFTMVRFAGPNAGLQRYRIYKNLATATIGPSTHVLELGNSGSDGVSGLAFPFRRSLTQVSMINCWNSTDGHFMVLGEYRSSSGIVVTSESNPLTTSAGSPIVNVKATAHGLDEGSSIRLADIVGTQDGILASTLNQYHKVTSRVDADNVEITVTNATAGLTGIGGTVAITTNSGLLRVWRSDNATGDTWSIFWELSDIDHVYVAGVSWRHIHGLAQNPYNGNIVIMIGDSVNGDGTGVATTITGPSELSQRTNWALLDNEPPSGIIAAVAARGAGWAVHNGFQRYRGISVNFAWGYMYVFPDAGNQTGTIDTGENDVAFWRFDADLVSAPIVQKQFPRHDATDPAFVEDVLGAGTFHPATPMTEHLTPGRMLYFAEWFESSKGAGFMHLYGMPNFRNVIDLGFIGIIANTKSFSFEYFSIDDLGRLWINGDFKQITDDGLNGGYIIEEGVEWENPFVAPIRINADGPI